VFCCRHKITGGRTVTNVSQLIFPLGSASRTFMIYMHRKVYLFFVERAPLLGVHWHQKSR